MTLTRVLLLINIHQVSESYKDGKFGENLHIQRTSNHQRSWKRDKFPRCEQRQRRMRSNFNKWIDRSSFVGRFRFGCFEKTFKEFLLKSIKGSDVIDSTNRREQRTFPGFTCSSDTAISRPSMPSLQTKEIGRGKYIEPFNIANSTHGI